MSSSHRVDGSVSQEADVVTHVATSAFNIAFGVWWIARDPAKVEDQVRFLAKAFSVFTRPHNNCGSVCCERDRTPTHRDYQFRLAYTQHSSSFIFGSP